MSQSVAVAEHHIKRTAGIVSTAAPQELISWQPRIERLLSVGHIAQVTQLIHPRLGYSVLLKIPVVEIYIQIAGVSMEPIASDYITARRWVNSARRYLLYGWRLQRHEPGPECPSYPQVQALR